MALKGMGEIMAPPSASLCGLRQVLLLVIHTLSIMVPTLLGFLSRQVHVAHGNA